MTAWRALQDLATHGKARLIGVCNFPPHLLEQIVSLDGPRCRVHQTKFKADRAWSKEDRTFAAKHDILLQAPSLITSNKPAFLRGKELHSVAAARSASPEQVALRFAMQLGVVPVVGSTSALHLRDDLGALQGDPLTQRELDKIEWAYSKSIPKPQGQGHLPRARTGDAADMKKRAKRAKHGHVIKH